SDSIGRFLGIRVPLGPGPGPGRGERPRVPVLAFGRDSLDSRARSEKVFRQEEPQAPSKQKVSASSPSPDDHDKTAASLPPKPDPNQEVELEDLFSQARAWMDQGKDNQAKRLLEPLLESRGREKRQARRWIREIDRRTQWRDAAMPAPEEEESSHSHGRP